MERKKRRRLTLGRPIIVESCNPTFSACERLHLLELLSYLAKMCTDDVSVDPKL